MISWSRSIVLGLCLACGWGCGAGGDGTGGSGGEDDGGGGGGGGGGSEERPDFVIEYGMNPNFCGWSDREIVFADAMARASEFCIAYNGGLSFDLAEIIPLGQGKRGEGWPDFAKLGAGETAGAWLFNDMAGSLPDGLTTPYVLTWSGSGSCRLVGGAVDHEGNRTAARVEIYLDPAAQGGNGVVALLIDSSSTSDPVRDVHLWLPGMEAAKPLFWQPYVDKVLDMNDGWGPYSWRTLDWTRVNNYGASDISGTFTFDLANRITPKSPSQATRRGMCPEFQVAFCNLTGANLHMHVPHRTDDMSVADYTTFLQDTFRAVRDGSAAVPGQNGGQPFAGLDEDLYLEVELSNEIWNPGFPVYGWMEERAAAQGISVAEQIAREVSLAWSVADSIFTGTRAGQVKHFLGGWIVDPAFAGDVLGFLPAGTRVDAIGPATYFGPRNTDEQAWLVGYNQSTGACPNCPTTQEILDVSRTAILSIAPALQEQRELCDSWINPDASSPRLVIYEAGQALLAGAKPWVDAANAAQVHPDMYDAYVLDLIPIMIDEGVDVVHWYSFMTDQDPVGNPNVSAFGVWDTLDQTITLPVPDVYRDEGAPKAAAIYRTPPIVVAPPVGEPVGDALDALEARREPQR
jgi:hypothetical protein